MIQRSEEWYAWRRAGIGSSDAAAILGCDPFKTAYQLWEEKTGRRRHDVVTEAMQRGIDLEGDARTAYETDVNKVVQPSTHTHQKFEWMRASVDGMTIDGGLLVEIKCPGETSYDAVRAEVPAHYIAQIQHQLAVTGAVAADLWVWHPERGGFIRTFVPDLDYIKHLIAAEQTFWNLVQRDTPPPMSEKDVHTRDDQSWTEAAAIFIEAETRLTETKNLYDAARQALLSLCNGYGIVEGSGVRVTTFERKGNVDYSKIPQLKGVDLEPFRKSPIREQRVTVTKK